jgi:hypothetical protein
LRGKEEIPLKNEEFPHAGMDGFRAGIEIVSAGASFEAPATNALSFSSAGVQGVGRGVKIDDGCAYGDFDAPAQNAYAHTIKAHVKTMLVSNAFKELLAEEAIGDLPLPPLLIAPSPTSVNTTASPNVDNMVSGGNATITVNDAAADYDDADDAPRLTMLSLLGSGNQNSDEKIGTNDDVL